MSIDRWTKKSMNVLKKYEHCLGPDLFRKAKENLDHMFKTEIVPFSLKSHCYLRIFPMIAIYKVFDDQQQGYNLLSHWFWEKQVVPGAKFLKILMKLPFFRKIFLSLTYRVMVKNYQIDAAGFQYQVLEHSAQTLRVDFIQCPYHRYCVKYGVPELCNIFCISDDITGEAISPHIIFERTQTLSNGDDRCDFSYRLNPRYIKN